MSDPKIKIKRSGVPGKIPTPEQVPLGEIALNTFDGKLYASKNVGIGTTVVAINPWSVGVGTDVYDTYFTAGNVGIGSTAPTSKLSIVGDANFSGIVTASGFVGDGSNLTGISTFSGDYNDLINQPSIPTDTGDLTNSVGFITSYTETSTLNDILGRGNVSGIGISVGISTVNNHLSITSTDGNTGRLDLYCEVSNAHYTRIEAAPHSEYSGNATVVAPTVSGDIIVGDTASAISQNLNTTGIITATSFSGSGSNLTGIPLDSDFTSNGFMKRTGSGSYTVDTNTYLTSTGSGVNLSGIVTTITAGSGISIDQSTGNVTITATGGGGGGAISIKDEGSILGTAVTSINFVGSGVIATGDNSEVTVTIDGGGGSNITIQDEGSTVGTAATTINFVGSGVSASYSGGITTVTVSSTGGGTSVSMGITAPTSPSSGNLWYNSNLARTFIYYDDGDSSQWVDASPFNYGESNIGMSKNVVSYIATEAQTTFSATYNVGFVDVFLNGAKLSEDQYTASNGTSIVLNDGVSLNDIVEIVGFVGGIIGVGIATAGGTVGTGVTLFDFRGPGISTVTVSSGIGTINITGGTVTSSLTIGTRTTAQTINLVGVGATILLRSGIGTLNF